MATPRIRLTRPVAIFCDSGAVVLNGNTTATTVASPMIQPKKTRGYGVDSSSRYMSSVAASAHPEAASTYPTVEALPQAPSRRGDRIGTLNSQRHTRIPTSAISAATTAVATPPDHSGLASTRRVGSGSRSCLGIGTVITRLA